mgnify:FL=1
MFTSVLGSCKDLMILLYVLVHVLFVAFTSELGIYQGEMPTEEDLHGVIDAVLRLQDTYQIPVHQFVDGTFSPVNNSAKMTGK